MAGGEGGNTVETVISNGKSQGRPLLIGRRAKCAKQSTEALTNAYVHDLRQRLVEEMEAQLESKVNQKVQENLARVLKKLGDANPEMNINVEDLTSTIMSSETDNLTGGTSS